MLKKNESNGNDDYKLLFKNNFYLYVIKVINN